MPAPRPNDVLVAAARMYYVEGRSQGDIARALSLSRSSVSRILQSARDRGIVEIRIREDRALTRARDLEDTFKTRFGLSSAQIVERRTGRSAMATVGEMAARVFEKVVPGLSRFGISWGATISSFIEQVHVDPVYPDLELCPLAGGAPTMDDARGAGNVALDVLARACGATAYRFDAPAVVESPMTWELLTQESGVVRALERARHCEVALAGIGSVGVHSSSRIVRAMKMLKDEEQEFYAQNPVGDICGRFFDITGKPVVGPTTRRIVGISMDELAGIGAVVGIAAGVEKAPGVLGALRTGVVDQIIVDADLARAVLDRDQSRDD